VSVICCSACQPSQANVRLHPSSSLAHRVGPCSQIAPNAALVAHLSRPETSTVLARTRTHTLPPTLCPFSPSQTSDAERIGVDQVAKILPGGKASGSEQRELLEALGEAGRRPDATVLLGHAVAGATARVSARRCPTDFGAQEPHLVHLLLSLFPSTPHPLPNCDAQHSTVLL
jgi:hypothetical protein